MHFSGFKTFSLVTLLVSGSSAWANKSFVVGPCEIKGGDERLSEVLCDLAQDAVKSLGYQVAKPGEKSNDGTLHLKALRLGQSYSLTATLESGDQELASAKLKAASPDEFDAIVPRLIRSAINNEDVKTEAKIGEVSKDEAQFRRERLVAKRQTVIGLGAAGVGNVDATRPYYSFLLGGSVDWTTFRLQGQWDMAWHAGERSGTFTSLAFAGNFFLTDNQSAPYIGPKVGFAWVSRSHGPDSSYSLPDLGSAFLIGGVAGWEFFRNYEASFGLELTLDYAFKDVGTGNHPVLFGLRAIVHR